MIHRALLIDRALELLGPRTFLIGHMGQVSAGTTVIVMGHQGAERRADEHGHDGQDRRGQIDNGMPLDRAARSPSAASSASTWSTTSLSSMSSATASPPVSASHIAWGTDSGRLMGTL